MAPSPAEWLTDYLERSCRDAHVEHLGLHDALGPVNEPCQRNLFAVVRD
jgi:hypothetical protein